MPRKKPPAPLRADPPSDFAVEVHGDDLHFAFDTRNYRVRGLQKNYTAHQLRVSLLAQRDGLFHLDTLDLCQARSRQSFIKAAAAELYVDEPVIKKDIGQMLLAVERLQDERLQAELAEETKVELTAQQRDEALRLLESPDLTSRILSDLEACGVAGESEGKLICLLACISRLQDRPLAVLIQSGSAAGKTTLMDSVLRFMPPEAQLRYSALTSQSLYYMGRLSLRHKILAVAEAAGVEHAAYALKLLQSDGRLQIATAGKDSATGRQQTEVYAVEGPVAMLLTTTSATPDDELQSRCLTVQVNESAGQTGSIHGLQRSTFTATSRSAQQSGAAIRTLHQNAQRLLEPLPVVIPWVERLTFRTDQTRFRRDHAMYLSLIAASTLLHQRQRPQKSQAVEGGEDFIYVESSLDDLRLANRLISHVLGRTLDGLLPQTREVLERIHGYVSDQAAEQDRPRTMIRFTQRELRDALELGDFQLRSHLKRLVELEYVVAHRLGHGNQRHYELLYNGEHQREGGATARFLLGLTDPSELTAPEAVESRE